MTRPETITLERVFAADLLLLLRSTEQLVIGLEVQRAALEMRAYSLGRSSTLTQETAQLRAELEQRLAEPVRVG